MCVGGGFGRGKTTELGVIMYRYSKHTENAPNEPRFVAGKEKVCERELQSEVELKSGFKA